VIVRVKELCAVRQVNAVGAPVDTLELRRHRDAAGSAGGGELVLSRQGAEIRRDEEAVEVVVAHGEPQGGECWSSQRRARDGESARGATAS